MSGDSPLIQVLANFTAALLPGDDLRPEKVEDGGGPGEVAEEADEGEDEVVEPEGALEEPPGDRARLVEHGEVEGDQEEAQEEEPFDHERQLAQGFLLGLFKCVGGGGGLEEGGELGSEEEGGEDEGQGG